MSPPGNRCPMVQWYAGVESGMSAYMRVED